MRSSSGKEGRNRGDINNRREEWMPRIVAEEKQEANLQQTLPRSKSYYYTNRCELLSLKEFNILVERAQETKRRNRHKEERRDRKQMIEDVERTIQSGNKVRLRLTSAVAQRLKSLIES